MKELRKLFLEELADRYDSENRLVRGVPHMADAATSTHLKKLMRAHMKETEEQVEKLEKIFKTFDERIKEARCEVTVGLLQEGARMALNFKGSLAINAVLISVAQKIEHYEIASYGCLREWAVLLGNKEAAGLLEELLDEEKTANQSLIKLARFRCNKEALGECDAKGSDCDAYGHKIAKKLS